MAPPITSRASQFILWLGDGATPEVFTAPCGLRTKGIEFTKEFNTESVPDCDDPDAPSAQGREVISMDSSISGEGILSMADFEAWRAANDSTVGFNVKVEIDVDAPNTTLGGSWVGSYLMGTMTIGAEQGTKLNISIELLQQEALPVWTDAV